MLPTGGLPGARDGSPTTPDGPDRLSPASTAREVGAAPPDPCADQAERSQQANAVDLDVEDRTHHHRAYDVHGDHSEPSLERVDPSSIGSVVLMRTPSSQRVTDSDARTLRVHFTRSAGGLAVTVPPSGVVAPPGRYYLFVNRSTPRGAVPSLARMVLLGAGRDHREAVQPYPDDPAAPSGGPAATLDDSASPPPRAPRTWATASRRRRRDCRPR